jgi:negative regulator of sigma E activity
MKPLRNTFAAAVVLAGVLGVSTGRTQPVEGGPDPSTILGQTQIQNEQYQQQAQQQIQQNQQQDRLDQWQLTRTVVSQGSYLVGVGLSVIYPGNFLC